jgi:hypothetical protein
MNYIRFDPGQANDGFSKKLSSNFNQLNLLLWKNFNLQKRAFIATILEICVPALFALILLPIRKLVKSNHILNDTTYPIFNINQFDPELIPQQPSSSDYFLKNFLGLNEKGALWDFAYQPNNSDLVNNAMKRLDPKLVNLYCKFFYYFKMIFLKFIIKYFS